MPKGRYRAMQLLRAAFQAQIRRRHVLQPVVQGCFLETGESPKMEPLHEKLQVPATHRLTKMETKLLHALQNELRTKIIILANGHFFKSLIRVVNPNRRGPRVPTPSP